MKPDKWCPPSRRGVAALKLLAGPLLISGVVLGAPRTASATTKHCAGLADDRGATISALRKSRTQRATAQTTLDAALASRREDTVAERKALSEANADFGTCIDHVTEDIKEERERFEDVDAVLGACVADRNAVGCSSLERLQNFSAQAETLEAVGEAASEYERALAAESAADGDTAGGSSAYFDARGLREETERRVEELRTLAQGAMARYRVESSRAAAGAAPPDFDPEADEPLQRLLGSKRHAFPTRSTAAQTQLKALGGGTVSEPASELLSVATSVALKKAKRDGLALLQQSLRARVCGLKDPNGGDVLFPETCKLLESSSLEQIATDPRVLQPGLTADLIALAIRKLEATILSQGVNEERVVLATETLKLTLKLIGRVRGEQLPVPSAADGRALVQALASLRTMDGWGDHFEVPLAFEVLGLYVTRSGKVDIRSLVEEVAPDASETIRARATELALLGVRALELAREADDLTSHDAWLAAIELAFEVTNLSLSDAARTRYGDALKLTRNLAVSVADGNTPEALTSAANLAIELLAAHGRCTGSKGGSNAAQCTFEFDVKRTTAILSGIASYSVTYVAAASAEKSDAELRAAREQALEGVVDLVTQRAYRHGEFVVGLGIPVGFSAGGQYLLNGPGLEGMLPQLQVPLGVALQRLPGKHRARGRDASCKGGAERKWMFDGIHAMVTLVDLGQYAAYDEEGTPSQLRWDSLFSPGAQVGWAFGNPANSFVVAAEGRYAPTLFSGSSDLTLRQDELGGAIRFGVSLAYYVPLVDFN